MPNEKKPPDTNRRAEIEQARRTAPVQSFRSRLKSMDGSEDAIKAMAEALRRLLSRDR
ncbi:MAG: hypothetical protein WCF85_06355 [Rhodospirillaceae bacterium]